MRISDWSSDVCSSDLGQITFRSTGPMGDGLCGRLRKGRVRREMIARIFRLAAFGAAAFEYQDVIGEQGQSIDFVPMIKRSEEHTSELQSLMRISYAVFCLKKKKNKRTICSNTIK